MAPLEFFCQTFSQLTALVFNADCILTSFFSLVPVYVSPPAVPSSDMPLLHDSKVIQNWQKYKMYIDNTVLKNEYFTK